MSSSRLERIVILSLLGMATTAYGAEANATRMTVPLSEDFASPRLDPAWTVHAAKDNTITVEDASAVIHARMNSQAHIERTLDVDSVRVSCALQPKTDTAAVSLLVSWDPSSFCEIGMNARPGRIAAREVLGTYSHEHDLGPANAGQWQYVAIELGKNCIRYLLSTDGNEFNCVRVSRRPQRLAGPPKLLVVGQGAETKVFPAPGRFLKPVLPHDVITARLRSIRVTPLDADRAQASQEELAALKREELDVLGEQELASTDDPTFESVARHFPPLKWPREAIGVKDHPFAIGVACDGALQFTEDSADPRQPTGFFEIGEPAYRFGTGPLPCSRRLLNGYMPIVILNDRHNGLELEQTAFAYSKDFSPSEPLVAYIRLRITNPGDTRRNVKTRFSVVPCDKWPLTTHDIEIPAHGSQQLQIKVPYKILPVAVVSADEFDRKLAEVGAYWDKLLKPGSRFDIPEQRVQNAYRAWLAYNFINVHKRGDVYHVCDGSGFYTRVYGYSDALYCNNMDLLGYHDLAEQYLDSLLTFMQPNGLLAVNFGDTDTGVTLVSMSRHYQITRNADWLRRVAPKMLAMCNWIIETRKATLSAAATQPAEARGLIRYRPYADLLTPAADYFSNAYLCQGLAATADAFAQIGMTDEAARLQKASDAYRRDILASMQPAVFDDADEKILPIVPDTRELWKESDGSANGYYAIIAPCMLEAGIPAWNAPEADLLIDALRNRGGLTLGVPRFHEMIDHAYGYGYWMTCLKRDEPKRAILGLYASMANGMTRDTYSAVECTMIRTGENFWTLPHTYSNTQQLRLLRNMLLRENGRDLLLGYAIPRPWLAAGKHVAVKNAPTLFGPASFAIEAQENGADIHVDPPTRTAPRTIKIRLRNPAQRVIRAVECQPKSEMAFKGNVVELHGLTAPVDLKVQY